MKLPLRMEFEEDYACYGPVYVVVDAAGERIMHRQTYHNQAPTQEQAEHIIACVNEREEVEQRNQRLTANLVATTAELLRMRDAQDELLDYVQDVARFATGLFRAEANKLLVKHGREPVPLNR